ncbi:ketoacyl-ACP synthase III family protein [Kitasatospora sp. NPDC004615]|uniref:ketoacyl-ACP synthase III family protein n=1 Tax=unclassified Kitasatospora TaxID=2633591 RepID=UPI00368BF2A4
MRFTNKIGIKSAATWLPETVETIEERIAAGLCDAERGEAMGITEVPVSADLAGPEMAVLAGRKALAAADWDPAKIGFLAHARVFHQGHEKWSYGHFVANGVGISDRAFPFGIEQLCNGGAAALHLAAAHLIADPDLESAMTTTGERFFAPVWDRWAQHPCIGYGDGGTAVLLGREARPDDALHLLALTHSTAHEMESMERGDNPFSQYPMQHSKTWPTNAQRGEFNDRMGENHFPDAARRHTQISLDRGLAEAGLEHDDPRIKYITISRVGPGLQEMMYGPALSTVKAQQINLGTKTGHMGAGDLPANLADLISQDLLAPGEFAIMCSAGGGFTWTTSIVQRPER